MIQKKDEAENRRFYFLKRHYLSRSIGMIFFCILISAAYCDQGAKPWMWSLLLVNTFIWPQVVYFICRKSDHPMQTEYRFMLMDSFLAGVYISTLSFSLWPSTAAVGRNTVNNMLTRGIPQEIKGLICTMAGVLVTGSIVGFHFHPDSSLLTSFLSIFFILHQYSRSFFQSGIKKIVEIQESR